VVRAIQRIGYGVLMATVPMGSKGLENAKSIAAQMDEQTLTNGVTG
jgi:hypothetical protein